MKRKSFEVVIRGDDGEAHSVMVDVSASAQAWQAPGMAGTAQAHGIGVARGMAQAGIQVLDIRHIECVACSLDI